MLKRRLDEPLFSKREDETEEDKEYLGYVKSKILKSTILARSNSTALNGRVTARQAPKIQYPN